MFVNEQFWLSQRQKWVLLPSEHLQPHVIAFQQDQSRLKQNSITLDIVKNLRRDRTVMVQKQDSNSWTVTVQMFVDERFLLSQRRNWVLLPLKNLQPHVLAFQRDQSRLKRSSITLYIVKNLRRGQIVTVQKQDSNSPNVC